MKLSSTFRAGVIGLLALTGASVSTIANADSGTVRITVLKAGWFLGASGGSGTLSFRGRRYALSVGGLSAGLVFGASQANLAGRVSGIRRASDVTGVYGAVGAGGAIGVGARAIVLRNSHTGALLQLEGRQVGLLANVDLSGLQITVR